MAQNLTAGSDGVTVQPTSALPTASFVLSLVAGILILAGVGWMVAFSSGTPYYGMTGGYYGMMGGYFGTAGGFWYGGWFYFTAAIVLVSGIVFLVGAGFCLRRRYTRAR